MDETKHNPYGSRGSNVNNVSELLSAENSESESEDGEQTSGRKRKRPMNVTCEACKQRKVKCDRIQPSCGWCSRNDHVCEYKERKKPGLRAGYGRELESRLDRLEIIIAEQGRQLAAHLQDACSPSGITSAPSANPRLTESSSGNGYAQSVTHLGIDTGIQTQLIDPKLRSSPSASRHQSLQYPLGGASNIDSLSGPAQNYHTPSANSLTSPHSTATFQQPQQIYPETVAPLPPYDLLYALVDMFFKHVNVWLPLLDRKSTLDTLFGPSPLAEADRVLLHAIVATSLRFSTDPRLTPESRQHYHTTSKQKVQLFGLENSSVRSLQALVIVALDVTGSTNGPPGWNMLSLISRSVVQLGLATEATSSLNTPLYPSIATLRAAVLPEPKSCVEDEERRRLFWSVFLLDRYATVATAFDFALDEKEIDRRLPCRDDIFSANKLAETRWFQSHERDRYGNGMADVHGHFSYHCELLGILGRIHQFLKRAVDIGSMSDVEQWQGTYRSLDSSLNTWHFSLPDDFANITRLLKTNTPAKSSSCGWIMLHAAYYLTVIRLNSSAAYPAQTSPIFSSSYSAMQRCLSAVENLKQLGQFVKMSGLLDKVGAPFGFAAWVAARVMLVHGSTMDHEVDPDIGFFVAILGEMGQHWDVAQRYSEILNRVLEEYRSSQRAESTGGRVTPSTVKILSDMRRCAFDLDFLISRQPQSGPKSYHPTRANTPAPNELEYLDVFDIFNFPRMPLPAESMVNPTQGQGVGQGTGAGAGAGTELHSMNGAMMMPNFAVPNPEADWLFHTT